MGELAVVLLLSLFVALTLVIPNPTFVNVAENSWVSKAEMPTARGGIGVTVADGKIYVIGGSGPIGVNEEYDPAIDTWTIKASMPIPQQSFAIAMCKGRIYCIGGLSGSGQSTANQVYDPATNTWQNRTSLPTGRYGAQAHVIGDKIYVIGGVRLLGYNKGIEQLNVTEAYDPLIDSWITKAPMPNAAGYVSAVVDDKIYFIGSGETQIYDPLMDTWSTGAAPSTGISRGANGVYAAAAATTGVMAPKRIYVYDGSILQVYNPYNNSWTTGTAPPTNYREYLDIAVVDDLLYFIGGFEFTDQWRFIHYATNERYTPFGYGTTSEPTPIPTASQEQAGSFPTVSIYLLSIVVALAIVGIAIYGAKRKH